MYVDILYNINDTFSKSIGRSGEQNEVGPAAELKQNKIEC